MSHPAKQINRTSCQIVNGEYDEAIVTLTNTLKTLKLVLSGDAKILVPKEMEYEDEDENEIDIDDDFMDSCEESASSSSASASSTTKYSSSPASDCFQYDFYSSPTSSSFLKTTVSLKGRTIRSSRILNHSSSNVNAESEKHSGSSSSSSSSANASASVVPQHQLQVSIFQDPIMVRGDHFRASLDIQICEELSYVIIYNLALAHHLKSVELAACLSCSSSSGSVLTDRSTKQLQNLRRVYLHKALSLYEHSHQILMKQSINIGVPVIHSMALVSNLSQIHHALGDHGKAEMCMQYLLSTIMYVIDCGNVDALGNSMDGFFNMILPLISGDVPAPAA